MNLIETYIPINSTILQNVNRTNIKQNSKITKKCEYFYLQLLLIFPLGFMAYQTL